MNKEINNHKDTNEQVKASDHKQPNVCVMSEFAGQLWSKPNVLGEVKTSKDLSPEERKELHERLEAMKEKVARDQAVDKLKELGKSACEALGFGNCEMFDSEKQTMKKSRIDTKDSHFGRQFPASPAAIKEKFQELYQKSN